MPGNSRVEKGPRTRNVFGLVMEEIRELACEAEPGLFFPPVGGEKWGERRARVKKAKVLCVGCRVLDACRRLGAGLERATLSESRPARFSSHGVWGGLERSELLALDVE